MKENESYFGRQNTYLCLISYIFMLADFSTVLEESRGRKLILCESVGEFKSI
jgi:hypothetical protein